MAVALAFALLASPALASQVDDAAIDAALGSDDTCAADQEPAMCALNALQLKADKADAEASAAGEERGACTSGLVGQIHDADPGCLDACPGACGPLGQAINAYLKKGGQPAAKREICKHKGSFGCAYKNWGKCGPLFAKAKGFGFTLPTSQGALDSQCRRGPGGNPRPHPRVGPRQSVRI